MAKTSSGYFNDVDAPELRFEESANAHAHGGAATTKRVANHGTAAATMPTYGVEDDRYSELNDKKSNMLRLQQELEKTQREARELELRRGKEDRFNEGRREISERLSRNLAKLDRELYNAQKAVEEISSAREGYQHHLDTLRGLQPETSVDDEMDRCIGAVEDAESEFSKTSRRLATVLPQLGIDSFAHTGGTPQNFAAWLRAGAAFSIPLAVAAVLVAFVLKFLP